LKEKKGSKGRSWSVGRYVGLFNKGPIQERKNGWQKKIESHSERAQFGQANTMASHCPATEGRLVLPKSRVEKGGSKVGKRKKRLSAGYSFTRTAERRSCERRRKVQTLDQVRKGVFPKKN